MYENTGIRSYQETSVASIGPEKLIVLLYEKLRYHLDQAESLRNDNDWPGAIHSLSAAQQIITELRNALDHGIGGETSRNLESLYDYLFQEILELLVDRDEAHLANARRVIDPLLASWRQIPPGTAEKALQELLAASETTTAPAGGEKPHVMSESDATPASANPSAPVTDHRTPVTAGGTGEPLSTLSVSV